MTLKEYREKFGTRYSHIARLCNCKSSSMAHIASGIVKPSFDMACRIEDATNGLVNRENWYPRRTKRWPTANLKIEGTTAQ